MENFNSLVAKYIKENPNVQLSSITEQIDKISQSMDDDALKNNVPSVFKFEGDVTEDKLTKFINTTGNTSLDNESATLFAILDQDGDGKLNEDELRILKRKGGKNKGEIDSFSLYKIKVNEDKVNTTLSKNETNPQSVLGAQQVQETNTTSSSGVTSSDINMLADKIAKGEDSIQNYTSALSYDDFILLQAAVEQRINNASSLINTADTNSQTSMQNADLPLLATGSYVADGKKRAEDAIKDALSNDYKTLSKEEQEDLLKKAGIDLDSLAACKADDGTYSFKFDNNYFRIVKNNDEVKLIETSMSGNNASSKVYDIKSLVGNEEKSDDKKVEDTQKSDNKAEDKKTQEQQKVKHSVNVEQCCDDLYNAMNGLGTNDDDLKEIILSDKISDDDFIAIVKLYEEKYGSDKKREALISAIDDDTSGDFCAKLSVKLAHRLSIAANNGNKDAIDLLCKELYSATFRQAGTNEKFVENVFSNIDDKTLSAIDSQYSEINKGHNLLDDIKDDYMGILGWTRWMPGKTEAAGAGDDIVKRIKRVKRFNIDE